MNRKVVPDIQPYLQRAQELLASHEYAGAAAAFEQSARALRATEDSRRSSLFIQAGFARIRARETAHGLELIQNGLALLARLREWGRLRTITDQVAGALKDLGLTHEADGLYQWLETVLPPV